VADLPEFRWDAEDSLDSIKINPNEEYSTTGLGLFLETEDRDTTLDRAGVERLRDYLTTWLEATRV
jgi:hypothetical protein